MPDQSPDTDDPFMPLTPGEQRRISMVLSTVSTQTLLHSLARLNAANLDARLIIAELIDRLPLEAGASQA